VKIEKNILVASSLLIMAVLLALFSLVSKGRAVPSTTIVVDGVSGTIIYPKGGPTNFWNNYPELIAHAESQKLNQDITVYDLNMRPFTVKQLISNKSKIIFKYTLGMFAEEVDSTLTYLEKTNKDAIVIVDADNVRYFKLKFVNRNSSLKQVYYIEKPSLGLLFEKQGLPFLFQCSSDLQISNAFVPRKEIPEVTSKYLSFCGKKLASEEYK
jgi:hypothetical protein